jgi:drug/metabolite transporter (DMT)-like permease
MIQDDARPLTAALWMTGAIASFSAMALAGREISVELDTFEIMMYRSFTGILLVLAGGALLGRLHEINTARFPVHILRNLAHFTGQNLWFYAVAVIPFAQVFALEFTSPLWVTLLAPLILGERLTRVRTLAALVGFIGILIVARPGASEINAGVMAAAASAVFFATTSVVTKLLTRTATVTCILFWLTVMQAVFGIVTAGYDGDIALPSSDALPFVLLIGCAGLLAHLCVTNALAVAPATVVVPFDFLRLPIIALVGMAFYGEPIDIYVFLGAVLIFGANYLNIWTESRRRRRP